MRVVSNRSVVWLGFLLWLSFVPAIWLVPRQELFELLNAVVFSIASGIVVGYAPGVWVALQKPIKALPAGDGLQIGIVLSWAATAMVFGVLYYWRLTGKDSGIVDHGLNAFSRWVLISAGFMHLAAAGSIDSVVPLRAYLRAGILTTIGLVMGTAILTFWGAAQ
jgi:hypothetical protein